jgi:hypothetical protein
VIGRQLTDATAAAGQASEPIGRPMMTVIINTVHADQLIGWLVLNRDRG